MNIFDSKNILDKIDRVVNIVNTTIGALHASSQITEDYRVVIKICYKDGCEVGRQLIECMVSDAVQNDYPFEYFSCLEHEIEISYSLDEYEGKDVISTNNKMLSILVNMLYEAVDSMKVECCPIIQEDYENEIPFCILDELDQWNEDQAYNEDNFKPIEYTDVKHYMMDKNCLYGISLGYYDINMDLVESDLVPELIGVLFESTEDFCYVVSDDKYIHFYSVVPFNDDIEFDIEEGLINNLQLLSETEQEETLEEVWSEMRCYNE